MILDKLKIVSDLKVELAVLNMKLSRYWNSAGDYVGDYAKDYSTGYEKIITIQGFAIPNSGQASKTYAKLIKRRDELSKQIEEAEQFILSIPDTTIRLILTLRYLDGETWEDISRKYPKMTADSARKRVMRYLKNFF